MSSTRSPLLATIRALAKPRLSLNTTPAVSRTLTTATPSRPASAPKFMIKRMPQASVNSVYMFKPNRGNPAFTAPEFTVILKPFQPDMRDSEGKLDERQLVPPWLPMPPHPATHERRYLRAPFYPPTPQTGRKDRWAAPTAQPAWTGLYDASAGDSGKWEPTSARAVSTEVRPVLRVLVASSVRRVHKSAVIRNRVRTRLMEAIRLAVAHMQSRGADIDRMLDPRRKLLLVFASASAYNKPMDELAEKMRDALRFVAAVADGSVDAKAAQRKRVDIRKERNRATEMGL